LLIHQIHQPLKYRVPFNHHAHAFRRGMGRSSLNPGTLVPRTETDLFVFVVLPR
jgi:hypothetical protein